MSIKVSIIIVSYNNSKLLQQCLQSVCDRAESEVIVVDNHSSDNSVAMVQELFPQVVLVPNEDNVGFGKANNIGASKAQGKYLLLINPDTVATGDIVTETIHFFAIYPEDNNAFGGVLFNLDGTEQRGGRRSFPSLINSLLYFSKLTKVFKYKKAYDLSGLPLEVHRVECVSGACIGISKSMYQQLGGFDENFFLHFEDIDLCKRIHQAGYTLWFYPLVRLIHVKGGSSSDKAKINEYFLNSLGKYLWKWHKLEAIIFSPILKLLQFKATKMGA